MQEPVSFYNGLQLLIGKKDPKNFIFLFVIIWFGLVSFCKLKRWTFDYLLH
jgi:hypothetical protein